MTDRRSAGGLDGAPERVVLITGGTRGIGAAISRRFLSGGWKTLLTARSRESYEAFARSLGREEGPKVNFLPTDFLSVESVDGLVEAIHGLGRLDALVNNAGDNVNNPLSKLRFEDVERLYRVNLETPIRLMQAAASVMVGSGGGRIVNIASIWSVITKGERLAYTASKFGLVGATKTAAVDLAPDGILVNSVSPGFTLTEMTARTLSSPEMEELSQKIPMGRFAQPEEVSGLVYFLCGYENTYITGQNLVIDGGYTVV